MWCQYWLFCNSSFAFFNELPTLSQIKLHLPLDLWFEWDMSYNLGIQGARSTCFVYKGKPLSFYGFFLGRKTLFVLNCEWPLVAKPIIMGTRVPAYRLPFWDEHGKQTVKETEFWQALTFILTSTIMTTNAGYWATVLLHIMRAIHGWMNKWLVYIYNTLAGPVTCTCGRDVWSYVVVAVRRFKFQHEIVPLLVVEREWAASAASFLSRL